MDDDLIGEVSQLVIKKVTCEKECSLFKLQLQNIKSMVNQQLENDKLDPNPVFSNGEDSSEREKVFREQLALFNKRVELHNLTLTCINSLLNTALEIDLSGENEK